MFCSNIGSLSPPVPDKGPRQSTSGIESHPQAGRVTFCDIHLVSQNCLVWKRPIHQNWYQDHGRLLATGTGHSQRGQSQEVVDGGGKLAQEGPARW